MRAFTAELGRDGHGPYRLIRGARDRLVRAFLASLSDPRQAQQQRLELILRSARGTAFGAEHGLDAVRGLEDFRRAVPIRDAEAHRPWLDRVAAGERAVLTRERVAMLLETSGTTGRPKHLPVTPTWARSVADAQALWVLALLRDYEALSKGSALTVVSPAEHARSPGGLPIGSNTGRMHQAQPWWLRLRYPVPTEVFGFEPSDVKLYSLLRFALQANITSLTTANPSTVLLLCRRLVQWQEELSRDLRDGTLCNGPAAALDPAVRRRLGRKLKKRAPPSDWRPAKIWPLAVVNCWKGGPAPYFVDRLPEALGEALPVREVGITASEGYFAIPLGDWDGGVLWTLGHLMEFIGEDGAPRWAWELEPGERVRLVITTEAGLYRYDLDDVLEVVGRCEATPVVRFVGKGRRVLSVTGEKVSEAQASEAVRRAVGSGPPAIGFTVGVALGEVPRFRIAVEWPPGVARDEAHFAAAFDQALAELNVEYAGKRESARLGPPVLCPVAPGTFLGYRARRVAAGATEGQVKDPILSLNDAEWAAVLGEHALIALLWGARLLLGLVGLLWLAVLLRTLEGRKRTDFRVGPRDPGPEASPSLVVVIPARDEEANIRDCVAAVLAQDYPGLKVVVLDDDSRDRTGAILAELAAGPGGDRLTVLKGEGGPLPQGWLGKPWACQRAARHALDRFDPDWLLFIDADVRLAPEAARASLGYTERHGLAMLSGLGQLTNQGFWELVMMPMVAGLILAANPLEVVNDPAKRPKKPMANGQFILLRRDAWLRVGGHAAVRDNIVDDVGMATAVTGAGLPYHLVFMRGLYQVRMYDSFRAVWNGWAKNLFLGMERSWARLLWLVFFLSVAVILPYVLLGVGLFVGGEVLAWGLVLWGLVQGTRAFLDHTFEQPVIYGPTQPVAAVLTIALFLWSAVQTTWGKAQWKGRIVG